MTRMSAIRYIARKQGLPESRASAIAARRLSDNAIHYAKKHGILYHQVLKENPFYITGRSIRPKILVNVYPVDLLDIVYQKLWPGG